MSANSISTAYSHCSSDLNFFGLGRGARVFTRSLQLEFPGMNSRKKQWAGGNKDHMHEVSQLPNGPFPRHMKLVIFYVAHQLLLDLVPYFIRKRSLNKLPK